MFYAIFFLVDGETGRRPGSIDGQGFQVDCAVFRREGGRDSMNKKGYREESAKGRKGRKIKKKVNYVRKKKTFGVKVIIILNYG